MNDIIDRYIKGLEARRKQLEPYLDKLAEKALLNLASHQINGEMDKKVLNIQNDS